MEKKTSLHTLLLSPPVWTPVTPYLALPVLTAFLRKEGLSVSHRDVSLDFFTKHLLREDTLFHLLESVRNRQEGGGYRRLPERLDGLLRDIGDNPGPWEDRISGIGEMLAILRDEQRFYDPELCIRTQDSLYKILGLASLAHYPTEFTFNTFTNPDLTCLSRLADFCGNPRINPFHGFYKKHLPRLLEQERPRLVGVSISTSHQMAGGLSLARFIKKTHPETHVILGGRHVIRLQEAFAQEPRLLPEFCDTMVADSGERPLKALISALEKGEGLEGVPSLIRFSDGNQVFNEKGPHEPISALPTPDFSDLRLRDYLAPTPVVPVRLSEGCYWGKCTFCSRYDTKGFETIPPDEAVRQIEEIHRKYGVHCFTVNDDCLTPSYLEKVAQGIVSKGLRLCISLWCKPLGSFTTERVNLLAEAGVRLVRWGVETGHPRILRLMNKGTNLEDTGRVLRDASEAGIWNHATIILGFPSETEEEAGETLRFLKDNRDIIHSSIFFRFILLNHSYIIRHPEEFGIHTVLSKTNPLTYEHEFLPSEGMDGETLTSFLDEARRYRLEELYRHPFWFYLRIREYLLLFCGEYGIGRVRNWRVHPEDLSLQTPGEDIRYFFQEPGEIPEEIVRKIYELVGSSEQVGTSWIEENLNQSYLVGYALDGGRVVGTMTHKRPKDRYVKEIEEKTGLDLEGYLERGYSFVRPEYRGLGVGDRLLKGLVRRTPDKKIYVTINEENREAVKLTLRNRMKCAARFQNERTGNRICVYVTP